MKDKKQRLIQAGIRLFGNGDYHTTSIQDIVQLAGVAKGSFYRYFHSKEDLLISILQYFFDTLTSQLEALNREERLTPKERIIGAFRDHWRLAVGNIDVISLHVKNSSFFQTEAAKNLVITATFQVLVWFQDRIVEHFGEEVADNAFECAVLANGLLREYLIAYLYLGVQFDENEISMKIFERLDDLVYGVIRKRCTPLLTSSGMYKLTLSFASSSEWRTEKDRLKNSIPDHISNPRTIDAMVQALEALTNEVLKDEPNSAILNGMYNYLLKLAGDHHTLAKRIQDVFASKLPDIH